MIKKSVKDDREPFEIYAAAREEAEVSFILESLTGPRRLREHTFLGFDPKLIVRFKDGVLSVNGETRNTTNPLSGLRTILRDHKVTETREKYVGGLVGYVSYDFVHRLERLLSSPHQQIYPEYEFGLFTDGMVYNHLSNEAYYFSHGKDRLREILKFPSTEPGRLTVGNSRLDTSQEEFMSWVSSARNDIFEGEIFQVVLSRRERGRFDGDLLSFYKALRSVNPSPYMYFLDFGERIIAGSSPEMLLSVRGRKATSFPIAGTRPLGRDRIEKRRLREELLADEKERAEHNMLVDLARNDLGRVCEIGSVRVPEYMRVEEFSHVQHIVSKVEGRLREDKDAFDALASLFPAGTVSGAPKPRAMEIIQRTEHTARGPYAGIVGYFSLNGNMDSAITIRTLTAHGQEYFIQAGAGIVADSDPEREWWETEHKLGALKAALEEVSS